MLDETFTVTKKEATEYTPIPEDIYTVELLDIISKTEETYDSKEARKKDVHLEPEMETVFDFQFVLLEGKDGDKDLRGRNLFQNYVPTYLYVSSKKGKNKLYQIIEALQGQTVSPEQEAFGISGKELNLLIGKQCRVGTTNKTSGDKVYSNIDKFLVVKDKYPALTAEERDKSRIKPKDEEEERPSNITGTNIPYPNGSETGADMPSPFNE
jgi:hypothetical protein